ncbi:hypothetical protein BC830DRAFT_1165826 [Chytriomyces sp. MP71]|nr:hypothetical protein BC830DRAFT_1165826 [Chytriomyces sp. MP71]
MPRLTASQILLQLEDDALNQVNDEVPDSPGIHERHAATPKIFTAKSLNSWESTLDDDEFDFSLGKENLDEREAEDISDSRRVEVAEYDQVIQDICQIPARKLTARELNGDGFNNVVAVSLRKATIKTANMLAAIQLEPKKISARELNEVGQDLSRNDEALTVFDARLATAAEPQSKPPLAIKNAVKSPRSLKKFTLKLPISTQELERKYLNGGSKPKPSDQSQRVSALLMQINEALEEPPSPPPLKFAKLVTQGESNSKPGFEDPPRLLNRNQVLRKMEYIVGEWFSSFDQEEIVASMGKLGTTEFNTEILATLIGDGIRNRGGSIVRTAKLLGTLLRSKSVFIQDLIDAMKDVIAELQLGSPNSGLFKNFGTLFAVLISADEFSFNLPLLREIMDPYVETGYRGEPVAVQVLTQAVTVIRILNPALSMPHFFARQNMRLTSFWPERNRAPKDIARWLEDNFLEEVTSA